jgi:hypothetical protein
VLAFQLINGCLLQVAVDCKPHVLINLGYDALPFDNFQGIGDSTALNTKERAFQAGISEIGAKDVGHRFIHRIFARDLSVLVALVKSQRAIQLAAAIEYPAA